MISDFKNKIVIHRPAPPVQTPGGGLMPGSPDTTKTKWAAVENRSGSLQVDNAQRQWSYDYKITTRYYSSFVERGGDYVMHEGKKLLVRTVSFEDEGAKRLVVLRCSTTE